MVMLLTADGSTKKPGKYIRNGGDKRGNSQSRRARKLRLLTMYGNGETCPCAHCGTALTFTTIEQDRIIAGGAYTIANLIPSCRKCNIARSDKSLWSFNPNLARRLHRSRIKAVTNER